MQPSQRSARREDEGVLLKRRTAGKCQKLFDISQLFLPPVFVFLFFFASLLSFCELRGGNKERMKDGWVAAYSSLFRQPTSEQLV